MTHNSSVMGCTLILLNLCFLQDPIPWQKLHKSIGQRCYIVSGHSEWVTNQKEDLEAINCVVLNPALTLTTTIDDCLYYETITKAVLFDVQDETTTSLLEILADLVCYMVCLRS